MLVVILRIHDTNILRRRSLHALLHFLEFVRIDVGRNNFALATKQRRKVQRLATGAGAGIEDAKFI
ncbi:hypothetical protein D3C83_74050 [compost metagenome]